MIQSPKKELSRQSLNPKYKINYYERHFFIQTKIAAAFAAAFQS